MTDEVAAHAAVVGEVISLLRKTCAPRGAFTVLGAVVTEVICTTSRTPDLALEEFRGMVVGQIAAARAAGLLNEDVTNITAAPEGRAAAHVARAVGAAMAEHVPKEWGVVFVVMPRVPGRGAIAIGSVPSVGSAEAIGALRAVVSQVGGPDDTGRAAVAIPPLIRRRHVTRNGTNEAIGECSCRKCRRARARMAH